MPSSLRATPAQTHQLRLRRLSPLHACMHGSGLRHARAAAALLPTACTGRHARMHLLPYAALQVGGFVADPYGTGANFFASAAGQYYYSSLSSWANISQGESTSEDAVAGWVRMDMHLSALDVVVSTHARTYACMHACTQPAHCGVGPCALRGVPCTDRARQACSQPARAASGTSCMRRMRAPVPPCMRLHPPHAWHADEPCEREHARDTLRPALR